MNNLMDDVAEFHYATDMPVKRRPEIPSRERQDLRLRLIQEEWHELDTAINQEDLCGVADACADLIYVVVGTALEYGIPLEDIWKSVHESNMAKVGPDGKVRKRADGKVLKPEGWTPPNIDGIIRFS